MSRKAYLSGDFYFLYRVSIGCLIIATREKRELSKALGVLDITESSLVG